MTETGWIIVGIVVLLAIIALVLLRRKPTASAAPTVEAPVAAPPSTSKAPPQTIAAEETPAPEPVAATPSIAEEAPLPIFISEPVAPPAPVAMGEDGDNLLKLKGVGPKIATLLKTEGITRYAQIAAWSDADIAAIDAKLGSFAGRPKRDNWVEQASLLAAGDRAGYEAKYGKL
jgi:predicted flap endonuclease-1-like 5' DNA nuclease